MARLSIGRHQARFLFAGFSKQISAAACPQVEAEPGGTSLGCLHLWLLYAGGTAGGPRLGMVRGLDPLAAAC